MKSWASSTLLGIGRCQHVLRGILAVALVGGLVWVLPVRRPGQEGGHRGAHVPALDPFERAGVSELREGHRTPALRLPRLDGGMTALEEHRERLVVVNFWATWCEPCTAEMPTLEALWRQYRRRGLVVLGVSVDRGAPRVLLEPYIARLGLSFPILLDADLSASRAWRARVEQRRDARATRALSPGRPPLDTRPITKCSLAPGLRPLAPLTRPKGGLPMATIEQSIEVNAPLRAVYNQWTQFEDFPKFMEGVKEVRQLDDKRLQWKAAIGSKEKEWIAEITEQRPDERIAWTSRGGAWNAGVVTFHRIDDSRTRVMLQVDYEPQGVVENVADALGVVKARIKGDLERFKEFIERRGRETGAWRGEIQQGQVDRRKVS